MYVLYIAAADSSFNARRKIQLTDPPLRERDNSTIEI